MAGCAGEVGQNRLQNLSSTLCSLQEKWPSSSLWGGYSEHQATGTIKTAQRSEQRHSAKTGRLAGELGSGKPGSRVLALLGILSKAGQSREKRWVILLRVTEERQSQKAGRTETVSRSEIVG